MGPGSAPPLLVGRSFKKKTSILDDSMQGILHMDYPQRFNMMDNVSMLRLPVHFVVQPENFSSIVDRSMIMMLL